MRATTIILLDKFSIEELNFDIGLTNNPKELSILKFNEINDWEKQKDVLLTFDKKVFLGIIFLIPNEILKKIFGKSQNFRKAINFYASNYKKDEIERISFIQELEDYNTKEKAYLFFESDLTNTFQEKFQTLALSLLRNSDKEFTYITMGTSEYTESQFHSEIGTILRLKELYLEAILEYKFSLKLDKKNAMAYYGISYIYEKEGNLDKALKNCLKAQKVAPNNSFISTKLGDIYQKLGRNDDAIEQYNLSVDISGSSLLSAYSHFSIGNISETEKKFKKAISNYKKSIKLKPDYDMGYYKLGCIYIKKCEFEKAIYYLETAVKLKPSFLYYNYLAMAYSEANYFDKAINAYKIALILKPKDEKTLLNLGFIYSQKQDYKHALLVYRKVMKLNPENPDVYYYIGLLYIDMNKSLDEILLFYKKAVEIKPNFVEAINQIGLIYYMQKEYSKAIKEFLNCIKYDAGFALAYKNIAMVYKNIEKYDFALEYYTKAITLGEKTFETYYNRGQIYFLQKDWKNSKEDLKKALELYPEDIELAKLLSEAEKNYLFESEENKTLF